ncbi:MAG: tetratricopeptide repeat protein [Coriobacteriia bacterium]|nr:tetratricopeptide repeat protein [Coriobacteriia bacterium]
MAERSQQVLLAEGLARQGRIAPAVTACYQALRADERDPLVHCLLGGLMLEEGFCEQAATSAARAIEIDPGCAAAYFVLGLAYDRMGGMWDRSVLVWQELAEVVPDLATAYVQLGEALCAASFADEAVAAWRRALEIDPREPRAMYHLAVAALKREGMATALPGFRKAGELDPSQDEFFFVLTGYDVDGLPTLGMTEIEADRTSRLRAAHAFAANDELFKAAELIRLVLGEHADDIEAISLMAHLYLKQESVNEAMACALRALTLSTHTPTAVYALGVAFARRPALADHAAKLFSVLTTMAAGHAMPHVLHAESLLALQRYSNAGEAYRAALALDPGCVRALFGQAAVALTVGDHTGAEWAIRRAAYHDIRRRGYFWGPYDAAAGGREQ